MTKTKTFIRILGYLAIIAFSLKSDILVLVGFAIFFGYIEALFFIQEGALDSVCAVSLLSTTDLSKVDKKSLEELLKLSGQAKLEDSLYGKFFWHSIGQLNIFIYSDGERTVCYRFIEQGGKTAKEAFGEFLKSIK